ncbi:histamine H4 receptor [Discoglossus pictus]
MHIHGRSASDSYAGDHMFFNITSVANQSQHLTDEVKIIQAVLMSCMISVTGTGNALVILGFVIDKSLRTPSNYFLLNLAISDFFTGAISIPMYIPYVFTGKWIFGRILCKLWLVSDYTMSTASAFSVVLISYDRFLSVTKAVLYRSQQNNHFQTVLKMAVVWILSFLLYGPAILFWEIVFNENYIHDNVCLPGFFYTWYFLTWSSTLDFVLPLICISIFNLSIYWNIKQRSRKKKTSFIPHTSKEKNVMKPYIIATDIFISSPEFDGNGSFRSSIRRKVNIPLRKYFVKKKTSSSLPADNKSKKIEIHILKLSKDKKVAKSLTILVGIFAICWSPYSFLMFIRAICINYHIDALWFEITYWCLWINSAINPIIYPLCHKSFKKAFIKVMFYYPCLKRLAK